MKRTRVDCHLVDLEAREADEDEDEDEDEEDMDQEGFFEADTDVGTRYSPSRRRSQDINENSRREGWNDMVASIEERASKSGTTNRIPEGDPWKENLDPAILAVIQNITRQPADDDYDMWRVRCKTRNPPQAGKWVHVQKGTYKGDVGYVLTTTPSEVLLLLIPRLALPQDLSRFKSETFTIALFNYETAKQDYDIEPIRIHDNIYSFANNRFEHGLLVKSYNIHSVSEAISTMPLQYFSHFRESGHPRLTTFPMPSEWCFAEDDVVLYTVGDSYPPSYKSGIISTIRDDSAELSTDEGVVSVGWLNICKIIRVGDFVEVTGGMHKGQSGWVEEVNLKTQVADVTRLVYEEKPQSDRCEMFQVNLNVLRRTTVPVVLVVPPKNPSVIPRREKVPWIGTEVVIGPGHASKGYPGIVKDVLCNQSTPSGLRLVIQITSLDSNVPFRRLTLDFDHVLEARHGTKLHHHILPESEHFMPRTDKLQMSLPPFICKVPLDTPDIATPTTPIPDSCLSSSPAWDPSSRTPQPNADNSFSSPSSPSLPVNPEHPLLDARLANVELKVVVAGGGYNGKVLSAFVRSMEGRLSFCRRKYNSLEYLPPEWVTPKYPNPKHGKGLLVVIKGEHIGKFARRIYHRFVGVGDEVIAILAVVNRVAGQADTLTGDQLEMDASHLCVCEESIEDSKRNDLLMQPLREKAREKRAKQSRA